MPVIVIEKVADVIVLLDMLVVHVKGLNVLMIVIEEECVLH
jgi:hypothetical protein